MQLAKLVQTSVKEYQISISLTTDSEKDITITGVGCQPLTTKIAGQASQANIKDLLELCIYFVVDQTRYFLQI